MKETQLLPQRKPVFIASQKNTNLWIVNKLRILVAAARFSANRSCVLIVLAQSTELVNVKAKLIARIAMVVITLQFVIRQLILIQGK